MKLRTEKAREWSLDIEVKHMNVLYNWFGNNKDDKGKVPVLDERIKRARTALNEAAVIVIGAGAGLSAAAGLDFGGVRFQEHMSEFGKKYGYQDMYSGDFYPYKTKEEFWAFEAKSILVNRFEVDGLPLYRDLYRIFKNRNYFIITTNVESQFVKSGFPDRKVFPTQGDYSLLQCAKGCHKKLYDNEVLVREMVARTVDCKIPAKLIPKCPVCGGPMKVNLRADEYFIEDEAWDEASSRYQQFISQIGLQKVVYLELGVGYNTPGIIRYPFEQFTYRNPNAQLIRFNRDYPDGMEENTGKTISFTEDIQTVIGKMYAERTEYEKGSPDFYPGAKVNVQ